MVTVTITDIAMNTDFLLTIQILLTKTAHALMLMRMVMRVTIKIATIITVGTYIITSVPHVQPQHHSLFLLPLNLRQLPARILTPTTVPNLTTVSMITAITDIVMITATAIPAITTTATKTCTESSFTSSLTL